LGSADAKKIWREENFIWREENFIWREENFIWREDFLGTAVLPGIPCGGRGATAVVAELSAVHSFILFRTARLSFLPPEPVPVLPAVRGVFIPHLVVAAGFAMLSKSEWRGKRMRRFVIAAVTGILLSGAVSGAGRTFEVKTANGVPQLCIDGQPSRARIFFGNIGYPSVSIGREWEHVDFTFKPAVDSDGTATFHFRFGKIPGRIALDNVRLTEAATGLAVSGPYTFDDGKPFAADWRFWPPKNDVAAVGIQPGAGKAGAGIAVDLHAPKDGGEWPDFHLYHSANLPLSVDKEYRFQCDLRSDTPREVCIAFYKPGNPYIFLGGGGSDVFASQIKLAASAGVNLISFSVGAIWDESGRGAKVAADALDETCRYVLRANPKALLLPRIGMDAPASYSESHRDECIGRRDAKGAVVSGEMLGYTTPSSQGYRALAAAALERTVKHLQATFGDSYAGCHPCGQNTGEWFTPRSWYHDRVGFSPCERAAFRGFVAAKYKDDEALRKAWGDPAVTRATADVPPMELWAASETVPVLDTAKNQRFQQLLDFNLFLQRDMADFVLGLAAAARRGAEKKLVLFFYGYSFEFAALGDGPAKAAHYDLERVLKSPDIDIICSPMSYFDRQPGGCGHAMPCAESVTAAGKMYLYEDDTRTFLTKEKDFPGWESGSTTLEGTQQLLLRNTSQAALRNFATWWMDLGASGWFDSPELWKEMAALEGLDEWFLAHPTPFEPEVALVLDERSMLTRSRGDISQPSVSEMRRNIARIGAPFGQYLLSDVTAGRLPKSVRLIVFAAANSLTAEQRTQLKAAITGKTVFWVYDPGAFELTPGGLWGGFDMANITALTGFEIEPAAAGAVPLYKVKTRPGDEVLAKYKDGSASVVCRGQAVYAGTPALDTAAVLSAARKAGVNLYADNACNVFRNGPFLTLHASRDGGVHLNLGPLHATDYFTRQAVESTVPLHKGETRILRLD
jgi:beta-galactosidase